MAVAKGLRTRLERMRARSGAHIDRELVGAGNKADKGDEAAGTRSRL